MAFPREHRESHINQSLKGETATKRYGDHIPWSTGFYLEIRLSFDLQVLITRTVLIP